ncbi:MAG: hypothetical protein P1Q69_14500 [Candidatus Thorarchaeota archaeon]|nr:hypothetical protein [Candidatus Thorarchaeota archaeon]
MDSITVTVIPEFSTTTTTETITTTPVIPPGEGNTMILLVIGAGISGVVLVVLIFRILKRKAT